MLRNVLLNNGIKKNLNLNSSTLRSVFVIGKNNSYENKYSYNYSKYEIIKNIKQERIMNKYDITTNKANNNSQATSMNNYSDYEENNYKKYDYSKMIKNALVSAAVVGLTGLMTYNSIKAEDDINKKNQRVTFMKQEDVAHYRSLFIHHASLEHEGTLFMSLDDLLESLSPELGMGEEQIERFRNLFKLINKDKDILGFEDFIQFAQLITKSDAEYEIAFRIVDQNHTGLITKQDFINVIKANLSSESHFNFDSDWMRLYFGKSGEGQLSYTEFTQLLKGLRMEILRQDFLAHDIKGKGTITGEDFENIMCRSKFAHRIPNFIKKRGLSSIEDIRTRTSQKGVTYAHVIGFANMLLHIPVYGRVLKHAIGDNKSEKIDIESFLVASKKCLQIEITPMEAEIVFHFFGAENDFLDVSLFENIVSRERQIEILEKKENLKKEKQKKIEDEGTTFLQNTLHNIQEGIEHFILGAIAGGIGATAVYPIDLVKTRMQNQRTSLTGERMYKNSLDCFLKTIKSEGVPGLYRGLGPQLVGVAPEKAIKLTVNDLLRKLFGNENQEMYFPLEILAGGGAGASQVIFTNPLEIVKIRLQVQGELLKAGHITSRKSGIQICRELGFLGLYKGAGACLMRDVPFSAIYFPFYAKMKSSFEDEDGHVRPYQLLSAGAIAGIPAAALVTPADVIKTRLQVTARKGEGTYTGIRDCIQKIWATEGPTAFWKGTLARVIRSSPQFGVTLLSYELLQELLSKSMGRDIKPNRPPTTIPVHDQFEGAFKKRTALTKLDTVEKKWFKIFSEKNNNQSNNTNNTKNVENKNVDEKMEVIQESENIEDSG